MKNTTIYQMRSLAELIPLGGFIESAAKDKIKSMWAYEIRTIAEKVTNKRMPDKAIIEAGNKAAEKAVLKWKGTEKADIYTQINTRVTDAITAKSKEIEYEKERAAKTILEEELVRKKHTTF